MGKKLRVLLIALVSLLVGGLAWEILRSIEPEYQGRPLTAWLEQYSTNFFDGTTTSRTNGASLEAADAIRQMGPRSLPFLLKLAAASSPSPYREKIVNLLHAQRFFPPPAWTAENRHEFAIAGYYVLGPAAKSSVPGLNRLLKSHEPTVRLTAAWSLGFIGPDAAASVPSLMLLLDDKDENVRVRAALALGKIKMQPGVAVPVLIQKLGSPNAKERDLSRTAAIIYALGQFQADAKTALPALLPFLNDDSWRIRDLATNAVRQIDPVAAAKIFPPE